MVVFIDTSTLAKRYVEEYGSTEVDTFFVPENTIHLATTTPIEIRSVLRRRLKEESLSPGVVEAALKEWLKEEPEFRIEPFLPELRSAAIEIIESTGIKTLDAIQLAAARSASLDFHGQPYA